MQNDVPDSTPVTYRDPTGQTITTTFGQAPDVVKSLKRQQVQSGAGLQSTQTSTQATTAQIPGIQAESGIKQIQGQQVASPINLSHDLGNKMTLGSAIKKYTALGMSADDVFKQYLAESSHGMPNENPQELQKLGISPKALGDIGTPGSFMDKYNTKNAISGLRGLENQFNNTNTLARVPFLSNFNQDAKAYHAARQVFGDHLSTLIPGAPGSTGATNDLMSNLPDVGDITEMSQGAGGKQFAAIEDQLLKTKGYSPKDLGITPRLSQVLNQGSQQDLQDSGGGDLLQNGLNDILNMGQGAVSTATDIAKNTAFGGIADADPTGSIRGALSKVGVLPQKDNARIAIDQLAGTGNEYLHAAGIVNKSGKLAQSQDDIINNIKQHAGDHPVNTAIDVLGPILGAKTFKGIEEPVTIVGEGGKKSIASQIKIPGKISTAFDPEKTINAGGNLRSSVINSAQVAGKTISGNNIVSGINKWAEVAMKANPGDEAKIQATVDSVKKQYAGKKINPQDAEKIYNEVDSGFTRTGITKENIQGSRDQALRGIFGDELEKVAPGWEKSTNTMAKGYDAKKGQIAQIKKNLLPRAIGSGLGIAGLDSLRHILGI